MILSGKFQRKNHSKCPIFPQSSESIAMMLLGAEVNMRMDM
jgi:hypothetical protein